MRHASGGIPQNRLRFFQTDRIRKEKRGTPISCPDAIIAILADFILSLNEVDVAIVYSHREDGIKFSVRSETAEVHAGELIHQALEGIGSGGGHAGMAGGLIRKEQLPLLGNYPNDRIESLFLDTLAKFTPRTAQEPPVRL